MKNKYSYPSMLIILFLVLATGSYYLGKATTLATPSPAVIEDPYTYKTIYIIDSAYKLQDRGSLTLKTSDERIWWQKEIDMHISEEMINEVHVGDQVIVTFQFTIRK